MSIVKVFDQTVPYVSGYSMRSRYIAESLTKLGASVRVFSSPIFDYENGVETIEGVEYRRTRQNRWNARSAPPFVKEFNVVRTLRNTMHRQWPSDSHVVHAHSSLLNGMAAMKAARRQGVPFLYESRAFWEDAAVDQGRTKEDGLRYRMIRNAETHLFRNADHVTVICEGLRSDVSERGIDPDGITVVPNGVDLNKFQPVERNAELARKLGYSDQKIIGFIGTFFHFEGLHLLVEAARELSTKRSDVRFLIVGGGQEDERLRAMVDSHGLNDIFAFTGRVKHDEVRQYYSILDILVYPRISKRITELVTPLKPLEAMALRKLVIGSNVGGIRELVDDGRTGLLFDAEDVGSLVERIQYALDHESEMQQIIRNAREHVETERNWLEISRRYLTLYREMGIPT